MVLTFSESVDVTDGVSGDGFGAILVNDGGAVTLDNADYAASGVMSLTLNFSGDQITGTAIAGLSVTYENSGSNSISDASNEMADGDVSEAYTDAALPAILSTSWQDTDRDGGIDRAVLTFSESVDVTDGGSGDGFGAILVNDGGAVTLDNADYAANSVTSLTLNFLGDEITGTSKSGLSITYDASGSNAIKDESGGTLEMGDNLNSLAYVDGAAPAIIAAETEDTNADGRIDRIYITFSETLDDSGISFGTSNFTFASHSFSVSTSGHPLDVGGDDQYVTLTLTEVTISGLSDYDTELTPALVLKANQIEDLDAATNKLSSDQSSFTVVDGAGPAIIAAITSDADADAKIDQIDLTFSENVDDSQGVDLASSSVTLGSSYVVSSINTGATADDDLIRVVVTEVGGSTYDTEETPTVTLVSSKIGDALNNQAITNQGAFTPSDGVAPVIVLTSFTDANGNGNIDRATLTFSEVIDVTDGVSGDGLDVTLVNDGTSVTLDNANYTGSETDNSGNSTLVLNFTNDEISGSTISGSTLTYTSAGSNAIKDESTATNEVVSQASLAYVDDAVPIITNVRWQDAQVDELIDRAILTFSEPVNITDGSSGDGFGSILVNDGSAVTLDNADYGASSVTHLNLNFTGDQSNLTAGASGLSATYSQAGAGSIIDLSGNEIADGGTAFDYTERMLTCADNEYIALQNPIVISESSAADFVNAGTLIFTLSSGFAFETVADATSIISAGLVSGSTDITITGAVVASSTITITYTNDGDASGIDKITIVTGLKIKYTGSDVTAFGTLTRTGGTATINGVSTFGFNILDLEVERVDPFTAITSGSPTDGQVLLTDLDICKNDLFDGSYSSLNNNITDFSITVDPDPSAGDAAANTVKWYSGSDPNAAPSTEVKENTSFDVSGDAIVGFIDLTHLNSTSAGNQNIWVTQTNTRGCESAPVQIVAVVYDSPDAEAIAGLDFDDDPFTNDASSAYPSVCSGDQITLGNPNNGAFSGYTFSWTDDVSYTSIDANPSTTAPTNTSSTGNLSTYTIQDFYYYLDVSDANGCKAPVNTGLPGSTTHQAAVKVVIDRPVFADIFSKNGLTFSEEQIIGQPIYGDFGSITESNPVASDASLSVAYNAQPYSNRGAAYGTYTGSFSGEGLGVQYLRIIGGVANSVVDSVSFTPYAVGLTSGSGTVLTYTLTEDFTGCSVAVTETIKVVKDESQIFEETDFPKTSSLYINKCIDDGNFNIIQPAAGIPTGFTLVSYSGPGVTYVSGSGNNQIYSINMNDAFNTAAAANSLVVNANGTHTATIVRTLEDNVTNAQFVDGSTEIIITPLPVISLFTTSDNPLESYYCDVDADNNNQSVDFNMTLFSAGAPAPTKNDINPLAYTLEVIGPADAINFGNSKTITVSSDGSAVANINLAAIIADGTIGLTSTDAANNRDEIKYRLTVSSIDANDPLNTSGPTNTNFGCDNTTTHDFTLFKRQGKPELDLSNQSVDNKLVNEISADNYLVEYCFGETIQNIKVETENAALPSTIRWYSDDVSTSAAKDVEITVPNGRDVASFILFGTNTPPAGTYIFNLTQTTNILSGTYAGCESDYATLTIVIHDIPNAPRLDLTASSKGDEQTIGGASGGYYAYEYCEGETVEDLNMLVGGISDNFIVNPTLKTNRWILGSGGSFTGSNILINAGGTIQSEALTRVNQISFKAGSTSATDTTTLEVRYYKNSLSADFEILGTIVTSDQTVATTYTYTIEEFNDATVSSKTGVLKFAATNAAAVIDDFVAVPIIDDVSFYEWYASDTTLIDGMSAPGTVQDNNGQGAISATGNVTATAAELFASVGAGSDNTPAAGTYTFYVARREDHNAAQTKIFEGCQSALTQIDIFVYGVPGTPTGMLTDINVSSGEMAYNARILPTDTIGSPGLANVQYRWYRNATNPKKDAAEMFDQTNTTATTSYAEIATLGEGFIATFSGLYYQVDNTYNTQIYLSQVTHLLNRVTNASNTTFEGCETEIVDRATLDITVYPVDDFPLLGVMDYQNNQSFFDKNSDNIGEPLELSYQSALLNGNEEFYAQTFYTHTTNGQKFTWYFSDASGTRSTTSVISTSDANGDTITASEMLIGGITTNETRYFLLTQTTDIEPSDVYVGSESDGTLLKINIYNVPDEPAEASSANASDPGEVNLYYCEGDIIDAINVISYDESYPGDILFYWYASEADALSQDSTKRLTTVSASGAQILSIEMGNDDVANDFTIPANMSGAAQPGTYTFYVTQASNKKVSPDGGFSGDPFFGSEGAPLELTIYVRDIPVAPAVLDQTLFICEGSTVPTFSVASFDSKITYNWYDSLGVQLAAGQTLTPQNTNNATAGFYDYTVTQMTDINLNNEGFAGCESLVTELQLKVSEIPTDPVTTGLYDAINNYYVYEICEGDIIPDFVIDNPDTAKQSSGSLEWIWYDQDNTRLNTNTSEAFNVVNYVDLSSLVPESPNDFRFRVTITTDINDAENFDGCSSNFTEIILRINGLPNLSFTGIIDDQAYCLEEDEIVFSASSGGIAGTGRYSIFNDFSQLGSGLEMGTNYAKLLLDSLHLVDNDLIDTVAAERRLRVGGKPTARNIYFEFTDNKGCINVDSVTNIIINPYPAIDFKIDNQIIDTIFNTCLNEDFDVFEERSFELLGIKSETGAGIGGGGIYSNFEILDYRRDTLSVGLSDDSEAAAQFTPKDARKSLSLTDDDIQDYDPSSTYIVTFEHTDDYGCTNFAEHEIVVDPKPRFGTTSDGFVITNKACVADLLEINVALGNMEDSLATFQWSIRNDIVPDQYTSSVSVASDDYNLGSEGVFITVNATSDLTGCAWQQTEGKSIGIIPVPEYRWENITEGNNTLFEFRERKLELYDFAWEELLEFNFTIEKEDGTQFFEEVRVGIDSAILDSVQVVFDEGGIYRAKLYLNSSANCSDSLVREFNILEKIQVVDSKIHTFDEGPDSWHTDSISVDGFYDGIGYDIERDKVALNEASLRFSTWQKETPIGKTINLDTAFSDLPIEVSGFSWVTNPSGGYAGGGLEGSTAEHSWVYSPAYDLSLLEKPTLSFNYTSDLLVTDGVVLQYSLNDGASWSALGFYKFLTDSDDEDNIALSSGVNWYTFEGVPGNPGNWDEAQKSAYNAGVYGWNTSTEGVWKLAAHKIDIKDDEGNYIIPKESWSEIRFRFALGSMTGQKVNQNGEDLEGFAFDNFSIYDRERIVLVETFGSMLQDESKSADNAIYDRIRQMDKGSLWINYVTNIYQDGIDINEDILYIRNKIDPDARRSYYSINEIPTSVLNGEVIANPSNEDVLGWDKSQLDQKELSRPDFKIVLSEDSEEPNSKLSLTAKFTSLIQLPDLETELSIRFFIVEKAIVPENDFGVYATTDTIRNVLRKILPNASGIIKKRPFEVNEEFTESVEWTPEGFYDPTQLRVIVMIQNEVTKDIYQVAFMDLDDKENVTGIENEGVLGTQFSLFPNPADHVFRLLFEMPLRAETEWILFDQNGIQRLTGWVRKNEEELMINVAHLPAGVYFIQLFHDRYLWKPRRFIIIHH
ncbi:hypothetical protein N9922_02790 [Cyclobacteriaceae bacterium]|nr:hypothetical protein [Cyclobacteriaceae bacterium]